MAPLPDYVSGTITLTNGSAAFTGSGTGWLAASFREGDTILGIEDNPGVTYVIESITDNDAGTLTQPWDGPTGTYEYRMRYLSDGQRVTAQARQLIELLGNGNLQALAGLSGTPNTLAMFTGAGAMVEVPRTDLESGATKIKITRLETSGTHTYDPNCFAALVDLVGGGAGGRSVAPPSTQAGATGGGGSGRDVNIFIPDTSEIAAATIVIGAGGAQNANGGNSTYNDGVNSLTCPGGLMGDVNSGSAFPASAGGTCPSHTLTGPAQFVLSSGEAGGSASGFGANVLATGVRGEGGEGGSNRFGYGGGRVTTRGTVGNPTNGNAGTGRGSGGSGGAGANDNSATGGAGAPGLCVITEYIRE